MLAVNNISCARQLTPVFSNLSFDLSAGRALLVEGANGTGKSSLLRLLAGLATPTSGKILWQDAAHLESLHYIGHQNGLKLDLTVSENFRLKGALAGNALGLPVSPILQALQLNAILNKPIRSLSAGQKRRVALAMLWLNPKKIWILDEPLTALDAATQHLFLNYLHEHLNNGGIAIISSHHPIVLPTAIHQTLRLSVC
ncbi:MAG: heme ABC exporter ATP-binding protein CcmA [Gammaproteobacteria bacterium]